MANLQVNASFRQIKRILFDGETFGKKRVDSVSSTVAQIKAVIPPALCYSMYEEP